MFDLSLTTSTPQYNRGPLRSKTLHQDSLHAVVGSRAISITIAIRRAVVG